VKLKVIYSATFGPRQYLQVVAGCVCGFTAIVLAVLGLLPSPHTPTHYLIAGTTPTGIGLTAAIVWVERRRMHRRKTTVRRIVAEETPGPG
jgi:threonine/homoserine/homoserine lactone efflux protein